MSQKVVPGGLLLVIEGIDGSGKTVLAEGLSARLAAGGFQVVRSREPTNGPWGQQLRACAAKRRLPVAEEVDLLLHDRRDHVETLIIPALARGAIVLLDRYFPSMIVYQGVAGVPVAELMAMNQFAPRPHLLFILDLDPQISLQRIRLRGDRPNAFEELNNLQRCRDLFLTLQLPNTFVIDAHQAAAQVAEQAMAQIDQYLRQRGLKH